MTINIAHSDIFDNRNYRYCRLPAAIDHRYTNGMKLRLREMRQARGWTQTFVAEKAGMSQSYYTEIELGKKQINARRLEALAKVFGVTPDALIVTSGGADNAELTALIQQLDDAQRDVVISVARSLVKGSDKDR